MKKRRQKPLNVHVLYSVVLAAVFLVVIITRPDVSLYMTMVFFVLYILGNGALHAKKGMLSRDVLIEYIVLSLVVLVVLIGAIS
jgi:hypothetical protein